MTQVLEYAPKPIQQVKGSEIYKKTAQEKEEAKKAKSEWKRSQKEKKG